MSGGLLEPGRRLLRTALGRETRPAPTGRIYDGFLTLLIATLEELRIVQVGANDGRINDPLFPVVSQYPDRVRLLLIEPQPALIPFLEENYRGHPNKSIYNGAIGDGSDLRLFAVKQDVWPDLEVPYAKSWPPYRAPTGVTSSNRGHVRRWLSRHSKLTDPDTGIEEMLVRSRRLPELMEELSFPSVDVLQVDAEGADDIVIHNSDVETTRPLLIHFEARNLPQPRREALFARLRTAGYRLIDSEGDVLAVLYHLDGRLKQPVRMP